MKVKVLQVEQPEGRSERATVELRNGVVLQVRSADCADLGTPQAEVALSKISNKPSKPTQEEDEKKVGELLCSSFYYPCFDFRVTSCTFCLYLHAYSLHSQAASARTQ